MNTPALPRWPVPLQRPPRVVQIGSSVHGRHPVERYRLPGLWCVHLYQYRATLLINGQAFPIRPGHVSIAPPDAQLEYRYEARRSRHLYAHLSIEPLAENTVLLPAMQDLDRRFDAMHAAFLEAVGAFASQPRRAEARVWDVLWQLSDATAQDRPREEVHPAMHAARQLIEQHLGEAIDIADLARAVGLSHNHLIRLFRAHLGATISGYIRRRRVERARHLLVHSTLPIKVIAAQVGIPDLHLFNKTVRRELGRSPRQIRAAP